MSASLQYETPENVQVEYRPAGLGTRFIAWFLDGIILNIVLFFVFVGLFIIGAASEGVVRDFFRRFDNMANGADQSEMERVGMYFIGIAVVIWGFGSFFYYYLSELLFRGQTIGKRFSKIRVVKANGFALDGLSIFVRNIFRLADQLPPLWVVPVLSGRHQRFGDMVAGTIVISDQTEALAEVREQLSGRNAAEARFRFDNAKLQKLSQQDFDAIERILDRWVALPAPQQRAFLDRMVGPLCRKLQIDEPPPEDRITFLEDLLAAEFRRQDRHLR